MSAGREAPEPIPWWAPAAAGVLSAGAGVMIIVWPQISLLTLALISGITVLVLSAVALGDAIASDDRGDRTLRIVLSLLGIIGGLVVIRRPGDTLLVLILALGIWLVLAGIVEVVRGVLVAAEHRLLRILGGLVDLGLGVLVLALPKESITTLAVLVGLSFIVRGIVLVVLAFLARRAARRPAAAY